MPQPAAALSSAKPGLASPTAITSETRVVSRLLELDIVRAFAILAVLIVHTTSQATVAIPVGSRMQVLYLMLNRMSLYAVPAFIFLSGVVLFYRYKDRWNLSEAVTFYRKRIQYILLPYLLWALVYYWFIPWFYNVPSTEPFSFAELFPKLLWGETAYHLYFVIIILQFYVVFPLLMGLIRRFSLLGHALPLAGLIIQAAAYYFRLEGGGLEHASTLAVTYALPFALGGWAGLHMEKMRQWLSEYSWVFTAAGMFFAFGYFIFHLLLQFGIHFGLWIETFLFHAFGISAALGLWALGRQLAGRWPQAATIFSSIGLVSFGIYFIHPMLLMLYHEYVGGYLATWSYHLMVGGSFVIVGLISWLWCTLLKRWKAGWLLLGR